MMPPCDLDRSTLPEPAVRVTWGNKLRDSLDVRFGAFSETAAFVLLVSLSAQQS